MTASLPKSALTLARDTAQPSVAEVRRAIARALREPATLDGLLAAARIPALLRPLVRPYVARALAAAASWVDPASPDPT